MLGAAPQTILHRQYLNTKKCFAAQKKHTEHDPRQADNRRQATLIPELDMGDVWGSLNNSNSFSSCRRRSLRGGNKAARRHIMIAEKFQLLVVERRSSLRKAIAALPPQMVCQVGPVLSAMPGCVCLRVLGEMDHRKRLQPLVQFSFVTSSDSNLSATLQGAASKNGNEVCRCPKHNKGPSISPTNLCLCDRKVLWICSWLLSHGHGAMELHKVSDQPFAVPVTRRSPEWGWLEYLLHASCISTSYSQARPQGRRHEMSASRQHLPATASLRLVSGQQAPQRGVRGTMQRVPWTKVS